MEFNPTLIHGRIGLIEKSKIRSRLSMGVQSAGSRDKLDLKLNLPLTS